MYITAVKALGIEALQTVFDEQYPVAEFRGLHSSLEYPLKSVDLPEVWVRYTDSAPLRRSGVSHIEDIDLSTNTRVNPYTRWRFQGSWEFVVVALSSLERDRVYDELISVVAFAQVDSLRGRFRAYVEGNNLLDVTLNTDEIETNGEDAQPGTPWGTDEVVYERTLAIDMVGDFASDPQTGILVPLSQINVIGTVDLSLDQAAQAGFEDWH